jgi:hypothetical protein
MAGSSRRPLSAKLGIRPGVRVWVVNAPEGYLDRLKLPGGRARKTDGGAMDFIQVFATQRASLAESFPKLARGLSPGGMLWVSWPKKASKVAGDLDENVVREVGLSNDLVDVKVVAVDDVWSGLKFVRRLRDRS